MPDALPIQLAIRLLLDSVSYGNAAPEWFEPLLINYSAREDRIRKTISQYLNGDRPQPPFQISIPKRNNNENVWIVPSTNDQIIIQACVSAIAKRIEDKFIDPAKVFSSRLNRDPNRLAFLEDQVSAWARFQIESQSRCSQSSCVLQIDIKDAFENITIDKFMSFIKRANANSTAVQLIGVFLKEYAKYGKGLPFLNDSIFFLGNAYFYNADEIIRKYSRNFVRYVDDYKIFGTSRSSLESMFPKIRSDLKAIGFELNENKIWLGTAEEYLESASKLTFAQTEESKYIDSAIQPGVFRPNDMMEQVRACLDKPEDRLHQGFGRLQMASIRRMRVRGMYSDAKGLEKSPADQFRDSLSRDPQTIDRICELINSYYNSKGNTWRLMWLLFLCKDVQRRDIDSALRDKLASSMEQITRSTDMPLVVRLWALPMDKYPSSERWKKNIEDLHALSYEDRGKFCYGSAI
jgi:hypothetical protein